MRDRVGESGVAGEAGTGLVLGISKAAGVLMVDAKPFVGDEAAGPGWFRVKLRKDGAGVRCLVGTPDCQTGSRPVRAAVPTGWSSSSTMLGLARAITLWLRRRYRPTRTPASSEEASFGDCSADAVGPAAAEEAAAGVRGTPGVRAGAGGVGGFSS